MADKENRNPPYPKIMHGIKGHLSRKEAKFLYDTPARLGGGIYVELGTYRGKSTLCTAGGMQESGVDGHIITIDAFDLAPVGRAAKYCRPEYDNVRAEFNARGVGSYITVVKGFTASEAKEYRGDPITFMFIDADHSYLGVKGDFDAWNHLVKPGGEIAFHDTQEDGVSHALDEIPWETYLVDTITVKIKP